jgi:hypothetical protein
MKIRLVLAFVGLAISFTSCTTGRDTTFEHYNGNPSGASGPASDYDSVYQASGAVRQ